MLHRARIGIAAILIAVLFGEHGAAEERRDGPKGLVGFSGEVRGVVVERQGEKGIKFEVKRVLRVWKDNKAGEPKALAGRTVPVGPRWRKGDDGRWHPNEHHVHFLRALKVGEELTLELRHAEREHFAILELTKEQVERARGGGEGRDEPRREKARRPDGDSEKDAEIRELRREIERLKAENRELRQKR